MTKTQKRKLEDLNLLDDFLFGSMVTYPEIGEKFVRKLLWIIFQKDFGKLTIMPQKPYYGLDTDTHGARLDLYLEEDELPEIPENATIVDMEPDKTGNSETLPKRTRFYRAIIDAKSLKSGQDYTCLKKVIIIMITDYDPLGFNRMVYTISNMCREDTSIPYDDGTSTVYLYTKGTLGNPRKELKELLHYIVDTRRENAVNDTLQDIQKMVDTVKQDKGVSLDYMKIFLHDQLVREEGREEERANTQRERKRADAAEQKADAAEQEIAFLKSRMKLLVKICTVKTQHPEWNNEQIAEACSCSVEDVIQLLAD